MFPLKYPPRLLIQRRGEQCKSSLQTTHVVDNSFRLFGRDGRTVAGDHPDVRCVTAVAAATCFPSILHLLFHMSVCYPLITIVKYSWGSCIVWLCLTHFVVFVPNFRNLMQPSNRSDSGDNFSSRVLVLIVVLVMYL